MKTKILIIILSVLIVASGGVTIWAVFIRDQSQPPITPDYPPQGIDSNQTPIEGDTGEKLESPSGGGAINVTYGTSVTVSLSSGAVNLYYANPNASTQNVRVLLMVGDLVVAHSELIEPGHQLTSMQMEQSATERLSVGGYEARLLIQSFDPASNEKAMIDTEGAVTLTVLP